MAAWRVSPEQAAFDLPRAALLEPPEVEGGVALGAQSEGRAAWERYTTARGEREAVQAHLAQAVSHSDDVKAELAAANARLVSAQGLPVRPTPGLSLPACYPLPACCGGSA